MKPRLIPYGDEVFFDYNDNMRVICKEHSMPINVNVLSSFMSCLEGPHTINIGRAVGEIRELLSRRINSKKYQDAEYFDIDSYLVPASKEVQAKTKDSSEYFVIAQVKKSEKKGEQVVVYAGKKGLKGKSQIFIDPTNGKMTFDQNDINPSDIFIELKATFRDGSTTTIAKPLQ